MALISWVLVGASVAQQRPLGRVVWTQVRDTEFAVHSKLYAPEGANTNELAEGQVSVDNSNVLIETRTPPQGTSATRLSVTGEVPAESPKVTLKYLHPTLDFTGTRFMFTGGKAWGPTLTEDQAEAVTDGTALFFGRHDPSDATQFTDPPLSGEGFDAYPVPDPMGEYVYFSRFFYQEKDGQPPGWYIFRVGRTAVENGTKGEEEPFEQANGERVSGFQPMITASGTHMFFVRQDPENTGSDIWYIQLRPELGDAELLIDGEGLGYSPPQPGGSRDDWVDYSRLSVARMNRPVPAPDGRFLVYSSDRDGDWDLWTAELEADPQGGIEARNEERVRDDSDQDSSDETWPAISGDGRFVAYMSDKESPDGSDVRAGGHTRIWYTGLEAGGGPSSTDEVVLDPGTDSSQAWPWWDQDEDPPHMMIVLQAGDGGDPMVLALVDEEPDGSATSDIVSMTLKMPIWHPDTPAEDKSLDFSEGGREPPPRLEYGIEDISGGGDEGYNPYTQQNEARGNSFHLVLSGKRKKIGLHRGMKNFLVPSGNPGEAGTGAFTQDILTGDEFDGLYLYENQRLSVKVYARDNRWRRTGPTSSERSLYSDDPVVEATQLEPRDPRSLADGPARPPYLQRRSPEEVMERKQPGICWFIEEGPRNSGDELGPDDERNFREPQYPNAPFIIFRFANDPPDAVANDPDRNLDIYLRVVARDLLSNAIDVRIPLHIRSKDFSVNTLVTGGGRR